MGHGPATWQYRDGVIWRIVAVVLGAIGVVWVWVSVIRTVVIPRPERVWLTTSSFDLARRAARTLSGRFGHNRRNRILGAFAPTVLISLPLIWSLWLIGSFAAIFWGLEEGSVSDAVVLSGSSLATLGFAGGPTLAAQLLSVAEALLGLAILALMISFLPTLYGTFSRREVAIGKLTTRAGQPPHPVEFLSRLNAIGQLEHVGDHWAEWEDWFVELGETHTTFPALIYFRSAHPDRSWLTAAETALDSAALIRSIDLAIDAGQADTMIRSGYLALRSIADFYDIPAEREPDRLDDLSVTRHDFEAMVDDLEAAGIVVSVDRDEAWIAFAGWRVNYDRSVCGLRELVWDLPSHWDRAGATSQSPVGDPGD